MSDAQIRMFTFYWAKKLKDAIEICLLITGSKKGFGKDHLPVCKIKPDHNDGYSGLFCDVIKTGSQPVNFFSCALGRKTDDELFFVIEHVCYLLHKAVLMKPVNGYTSQLPENKPKRWFEQFLLADEFETFQSQHFSECKANKNVLAAGVRRHDNDGLF